MKEGENGKLRWAAVGERTGAGVDLIPIFLQMWAMSSKGEKEYKKGKRNDRKWCEMVDEMRGV